MEAHIKYNVKKERGNENRRIRGRGERRLRENREGQLTLKPFGKAT